MNKKRISCFWFFALLFTFNFQPSTFNSSVCYALGPGTTGANFLKIGVGARPAGMAEAFVAVADDASAVYWNPAGLAQVTDREIFFMQNLWFQGISQEYVTYAHGIKNICSFGISGAFITSGDITRTSEDAFGNYAGPGGNFSVNGYSAILSFAQKVEKLNIGVNIKWIRSVVDVTGGNAFGIDFGFLYKPETLKNLSMGANIQNVGSRIEYTSGASDPLPFNLKIGISYIIGTEIGPLKTALDVNIPVDNSVSVHSGVEYYIADIFAIRIGYKTDRISDLGGLSGLCCGLGFKWQNYFIDYAFIPYGDIGSTHRVSVIVKF